jgi:RND family efflux transporter MFP subunit
MTKKRLVTLLLVAMISLSGVSILLNNARAADSTEASASSQTVASTDQSQTTSTTEAGAKIPAIKVKTEMVSKNHTSTIELVGTVKANDQVKIFGTSAGQLAKTLVSEGQKVKKGDPLFVIGGINAVKPAVLIQLEVAQENYNAAKKGLDLTKQGNAAALRASELQLESARHATEGSYLDLQVMDQNIGAVKNGLFYLNDSLNASETNNDLSLEKASNAIDSLKDAINSLERQKTRLEEMISNQGDEQSGEQQSGSTATDPATQLSELDKTIEDLYSQLEAARIGYEQLEQAKVISENQILGQIATSNTQGMVLNITRDSTATKQGLTDGTSDAARLAEEGYNATKVKNQASLLQSQTQLDLASSNLELAKIQADSLIVRAPLDGVIGEITANEGDIVSQQSSLTQVSGLNNFELRTSIDAENADLISVGNNAEVMIGGKYMKLPIKSIGAIADPATRLVTISIALPKVKFRANQTLNVRLTLEHGNLVKESGSFYIPLDALIIGTDAKYVYTVNNGVAERKVVETGEVHGDQVEILNGLSEDELVITEGSKTIVENQKVELS